MEVIMSSSIQECSLMENGNGDLNKKLNANLESFEKLEDTDNHKSKPKVQKSVIIQEKENTKVANGEIGDRILKKRKKEKTKNKYPESGANLSTCENTQEGLSSTKLLEVKSGETVLCKTATSGANMVSIGEDHAELDTNKMQENGEVKKRKKSKLKNKEPTLDESLNPQNLNNFGAVKHETDSATTATDNRVSKKKKRPKRNYNPASSDMLSTSENTDDNAIAKKDADISEMGPTTVALKSEKPAELEVVQVKAKSALTRKSQTLWVKEITPVVISQNKKLLIFDVNGLLADVVTPSPKGIKADYHMSGGRAVFKRPYVDDFLCFCFERFNVAIWSSRKMRRLRPLVKFLLGDLMQKLLFMWDGTKCTNSGLQSLDVKHKRVVVKDLRKFWEKDGPSKLWVKGTFHESNTLLVDDSPYKALLNPKHTGIFPASYSYTNTDDNFLGPKGELRTYLEGLAVADDVKTYVKQHPFGQSAIDEQSPDWGFYSQVLERLNTKIDSAKLTGL